ncbi:MAG: hypothetical protein ACLP4V_13205 [Methylocella sp.]
MLLRKRTLLAIAFAGTSVVADPGIARATDPALPLTIRPLQGASFDIGTKRAVSYFLSDDEECKLTLMLAELVNDDDEANGLAATRMTVAVEVGKAARLDTAEGKSLEFKCQPGGQEMSIDIIEPGRILAPSR